MNLRQKLFYILFQDVAKKSKSCRQKLWMLDLETSADKLSASVWRSTTIRRKQNTRGLTNSQAVFVT